MPNRESTTTHTKPTFEISHHTHHYIESNALNLLTDKKWVDFCYHIMLEADVIG